MFTDTSRAALTTQLCHPETLHAAWRKVRANKGGPGGTGQTLRTTRGTTRTQRCYTHRETFGKTNIVGLGS